MNTRRWSPARLHGGGRPAAFFVAGLVVFSTACAAGSATSTGGEDAAPPAREETANEPIPATFTADQADEGEDVFSRVCSTCHGRTEFTGPIFRLTWMADPVGHLYQHISATMPQEAPGSLMAEEYVAILAYFLRLNDGVPGDAELPMDLALLNRMVWR